MKNKNLTLRIAATLGGLATAQGCDAQSSTPIANDLGTDSIKLEQQLTDKTADSIRLEKQLSKLAKTKYTGKLEMGAMCYAPMMLQTIGYVCPYCGDTIKEKYDSWVLYNIESIERIVGEIKSLGYDVVLDKTEYCPRCSKRTAIGEPELIFKIRFSAKADYHIAKSNIVNDYQCLLAFLLNKNTYSGGHGEEYALHDNVAIIQKMTGLGKNLKIEK